jgi:hypothetical protein
MARIALLFLAYFVLPSPGYAQLRVSPESVILESPEATQQMLVVEANARRLDRTRDVQMQVTHPNVAQVDKTGLIEARGEGKTLLIVQHQGQEVRVPIEVRNYATPAPVSFEQQIIPLLTKATCNSGGCHGKSGGQNGFQLSVFGFDPEADFRALTMETRGRRVFPAAPASSLLLKKATGTMPHGGGAKITEGSLPYRRLLRWVREGSPLRTEAVPPITRIEVEPTEQVLALGGTQQLRVTAVDEKGQRHCVTAEAEFESNAPTIAGIDRRSLIQAGKIPGQAAILVRFMGQVAVCRITVPRPDVKFARPAEANFIDRHVWNQLERLGSPPSDPADDATFLRRVYLDTIGTLPTATEAREFLANKNPDKRAQLIDELLDRSEYADYWTMRWSDLLRVDRDAVTAQGSVALSRWLRRQFAENRPYDQFVREILTARGSITRESPAGFFKALEKPEVMSRSISQLFLGVRIECAQCHHHPSEKWAQDDYLALAGFFTGIGVKKLPNGDDAVVAKSGTDLKHPRTGKFIPASPLGAAPVEFEPGIDRRAYLADWMTSPENPYLARALANRLWAHYFGRGLVEPIDDLRATNPATNEPLLDDLAQHLKKVKFDVKALTRTMLNSRVYQLGAETSANRDDEQNFSHVVPRTLPAEVLLDAISQTTGVAEKFNGWPEGVRAIQMWDNRIPSYFLQIFGRPVRASVCECERSNDPSIAQALHLLNAPEIQAKVKSHKGTARRMAESRMSESEIVEELYLGMLARRPTERERGIVLELFRESAGDRRAAVEDAMWVLLNSKEFLYRP